MSAMNNAGIELVFFAIIIGFTIVGLVHGYRQELGVTIILMVILGLLQLAEDRFQGQFNQIWNWAIAGSPIYRDAMRGVIFCLLLLFVVFVAYQSDFLRFPGKDTTFVAPVLNASSGMLNGYLLAGSLWYYLGQAGWPYLSVRGPFSPLYWSAWQLLPPHIIGWPIMFLLAVSMIVARCWK
jgi:hypothetical protein